MHAIVALMASCDTGLCQSLLKQIFASDTTPKSSTQQECTTQFAMQTVRLLWWRRKSLPDHDWDQASDTISNILVLEVIHVR